MINPGFAPRLAFCFLFCATTICDAFTAARITPQASGVEVRLRGVSVVDGDVAWASGQKGTVLRTRDGGKHWETRPVPDAKDLDFRDIEAFDADNAVILAIGPGPASRVYRTEDGGATWILTLKNEDPRAFFDCMVFEGARGWILGDPVEGHFQIRSTTDAGRHWTLAPDGPRAEEGEAAFAASGTCIARSHGSIVVATGGMRSRLLARMDGQTTWRATGSGMGRGLASAGMFSIADAPASSTLVGVGGDYSAESSAGNAARFEIASIGFDRSHEGVATHALPAATAVDVRVLALPPPPGYRSAIACGTTVSSCIAVGPTGIDRWNGSAWIALSSEGYDAISIAGRVAWVSGDKGRIARIELAD